MKVYAKPTLRIFGTIEELTQAKVAGGGFDGYFTWIGQAAPILQIPPPGAKGVVAWGDPSAA